MNDFLNRNKKISISQVNILEFYQFYKNYIVSGIFSYTLETGITININFNEDNFPHLLGLHKFKKVASYNSQNEVIKAIENIEFDIKCLKKYEADVLSTELKDRLTYFPCLNFLLENADTVIEFDATKCIPTTFKATFLLSTQKIRVAVFLAVRKIKDDVYDCVPVSFIVDRFNKYQIDKQEKFKIINYEKIEK